MTESKTEKEFWKLVIKERELDEGLRKVEEHRKSQRVTVIDDEIEPVTDTKKFQKKVKQ